MQFLIGLFLEEPLELFLSVLLAAFSPHLFGSGLNSVVFARIVALDAVLVELLWNVALLGSTQHQFLFDLSPILKIITIRSLQGNLAQFEKFWIKLNCFLVAIEHLDVGLGIRLRNGRGRDIFEHPLRLGQVFDRIIIFQTNFLVTLVHVDFLVLDRLKHGNFLREFFFVGCFQDFVRVWHVDRLVHPDSRSF